MKSRFYTMLSLSVAVLAGLVACDSRDAVTEKTAAVIEDRPDPYEQEAPLSDMTLTHVRSGDALQALWAPVRFKAAGAALITDLERYSVYLNDVLLNASALVVAGDSLSIHAALKEGNNKINVIGPDQADLLVQIVAEVWAGSATVQGRVVDESGNPVGGATVVAALGDDSKTTATTSTDSAGKYVLQNFPARTVLVSVTGPTGIPGSTSSLAGSAFPDVVLYKFGVPVPAANNDFLAGTKGWINRNGANLSLEDHVEDPGPKPDALPQPMPAPGQPQKILPAAPTLLGPKKDLRVGTSGEGPKTVTYTFSPPADSKTARIRYRFQTDEFPTYFGSRYNDAINVALRSQSGKSVARSEAMNELGKAAFDTRGSTAWKDLSMELEAAGEPVQVDVTVANVGDNRMESAAIVNAVSASPLAITQASLFDIDNTPLHYLSAASHTYFNATTRVHAQFKLAGPAATQLTSLELQVQQAGVVKARAPLTAALSPSMYKTFGRSGIELSSAQLAFEIPAKELAGINTSTDGSLNLKLVAVADAGYSAEKDMGSVRLLDRWTGTDRYGGRDAHRGGDDWLTAATRGICSAVSVSWGDFSNMNAGSFAPDHRSHTTGLDADGWYAGYSARDAASAAKMLALLNTEGVSSKVKTVLVTHTPSPGNAFYDAYKDVRLADGRKATSVIRNYPGHTTHFHWSMD